MQTMKINGIDIRVFEDPEDIEELLNKELEKYPQVNNYSEFPDPYDLYDMGKAINIFERAVADNQKIKLVCDSDMDGLGTYVLWYNFFTHFPYNNVELLITDRKKGYGFIPEYVDDTTGLYITSDNGITSIDATVAAQSNGAKVIICDHHQPDMDIGLPPADAIIDPYHPKDNFPYKDISGTFVLWFFLKALSEKYNLSIDPYEEFLPEIALTTLSDVMPINQHINRYVVKDFVDKFCKNDRCHREYLNTFREFVNSKPTAESFSFGLVPMINATQRMTKADHGAMFLIAPDKENSEKWFEYIKGLNDGRKKRQQDLLSYIEKYYKDYIKQPFIVIPGQFNKDFKGVLGVIAGNLAQKFNKPAIVLNYNEKENAYTGSGRSVGELNILDVLRDNEHIVNVGGHKQALGITIKKEKFDDFFLQLQEDIKKIPEDILVPKKIPFGYLPLNKIDWDFFQEISKFEPFGHRFRKPVFVSRVTLKSASLMGKQRNHLRFVVTDQKGLVKFDGVKFFETSVPEKGKEYWMYFTLDKDDYKSGENLKLMAEDFILINEEKK
jgi:single-stranded-DNA-specific exonuclease